MEDYVEIANGASVSESDGIFEKDKKFLHLMTQYHCAMLEIKTKLDVLNMEFSLENERNPFESISTRLKTPKSIYEKLIRYGFEVSVDSIEKNLHDVAGVRVICSFVDDMYMLADKLCSQDDVRVWIRKDYIENPKPNGYRSLHLILEVPVFFSNEKKYMQVEVQFRTVAMDFWASLEHKLKYKKDIDDKKVTATLKACAEEIHALDLKMQDVREQIERLDETDDKTHKKNG